MREGGLHELASHKGDFVGLRPGLNGVGRFEDLLELLRGCGYAAKRRVASENLAGAFHALRGFPGLAGRLDVPSRFPCATLLPFGFMRAARDQQFDSPPLTAYGKRSCDNSNNRRV